MTTKNERRTCVTNGLVVGFQRQTKLLKVNYQSISWFRNLTKLDAKLVVEPVIRLAKLIKTVKAQD